MLTARVGSSRNTDVTVACQEACGAALRDLGAPPDFALVFATSAYPQSAVTDTVKGLLPTARVSGCSGEGVIADGRTDEVDYALAVMAVRSDTVRFEPFLIEGYGEDPCAAGQKIADFCNASGTDDLVGIVLFPDGLTGDSSALLATVATALARPAPVLGGASADCQLFEQTHQYCDATAATNAVCGFTVRGGAELRFAVSHGCTTIGLDHIVTRTENGWVYELDGQPAWSVFREYLDDETDDLTAEGIVYLCVGLFIDQTDSAGASEYVVRTPVRLDKDTGALFFPGGGLTTGARIRLTRRDADLIRTSAADCAASLVRTKPDQRPALVLQFDCAGRGRILFGDHAAKEILTPLQEALGFDVPWIGFHTFGEIAPLAGAPYFHNYSVALCALFEKAAT